MSEPVFFFDLGGVLIENRGFEVLAGLGEDLHDGPELRERWLRSEAVAAFERGLIDPGTFAHRAIREFGLSVSPEAFTSLFCAWVKDFYPGARELVARLKRGHRVGCLSNCNALHWREDWASLFHFPLFSHHLGCVKPDPEAFLAMARAAGVAPERIIYFDDAPRTWRPPAPWASRPTWPTASALWSGSSMNTDGLPDAAPHSIGKASTPSSSRRPRQDHQGRHGCSAFPGALGASLVVLVVRHLSFPM